MAHWHSGELKLAGTPQGLVRPGGWSLPSPGRTFNSHTTRAIKRAPSTRIHQSSVSTQSRTPPASSNCKRSQRPEKSPLNDGITRIVPTPPEQQVGTPHKLPEHQQRAAAYFGLTLQESDSSSEGDRVMSSVEAVGSSVEAGESTRFESSAESRHPGPQLGAISAATSPGALYYELPNDFSVARVLTRSKPMGKSLRPSIGFQSAQCTTKGAVKHETLPAKVSSDNVASEDEFPDLAPRVNFEPSAGTAQHQNDSWYRVRISDRSSMLSALGQHSPQSPPSGSWFRGTPKVPAASEPEPASKDANPNVRPSVIQSSSPRISTPSTCTAAPAPHLNTERESLQAAGLLKQGWFRGENKMVAVPAPTPSEPKTFQELEK